MTRARAAAEESRLRFFRSVDAWLAVRACYRRVRHAVRLRAGLAAPLAALLLFIALATLALTHIAHQRALVLAEAEREVNVRASELAHRIDRALGYSSGLAPIEALHQALESQPAPRGARMLVVDDKGTILASEPPLLGRPATLASVLGEAAPLAVMAEGAGALQIETESGDALASVRNLTSLAGQVAVTVSIAEALEPWRDTARIMLAMLAATGLILGGTVGAARLDAERANGRAKREAVRRAHIDLALARGRCGLWDWDLQRNRIVWSPSMFEMLSLPYRPSLSIADLQDLLHPDDGPMAEIAARAAASSEGAVDLEFRLRARDGHWVWLRKRAKIVCDPEDGARRLVGIALDVSDRKREAERFATADQRLREAIEAISEAFVLWDSTNRLVLCNSKYQRLHNLPAEAVRSGVSYAELAIIGSAPIVASETVVNPLEPALGEGRAKTYEARLSDGRWLQVNERRTRDGGFVSVGTDITALKEHEQQLVKSERLLLATVAQLRQSRRSLEAQAQQLAELAERYHEQKAEAEMANRAKAQFLANMSHELRTPLNAIIGFSEMMETETYGPLGSDKYREYSADILTSGRYLLNVFNDVLDMSSLESGRIQLNYAHFAIHGVVAKAAEDIASTANGKGVRLQIEVDAHEMLHADAGAIERILTTLLRNAVKFAPEGGSVTVGAQTFRDQIYFYVEDDGPGIAKEDIARLGRPFEQTEDTTMDNGMKGSGLGLSIANSLVELHGGVLRITSKPGEGTVVLVTVPKLAPGRRAMTNAVVA